MCLLPLSFLKVCLAAALFSDGPLFIAYLRLGYDLMIRRDSRRHLSLACAMALSLASAAGSPVSAQSGATSIEARDAQFVFVIDDSGSMRQNDPDRLAVFAVRSLLSMLDDRDQVSIVRLNAADDGERVLPPRPLREVRADMERLLALDGPLASYSAQKTPCGTALEAVKRALNPIQRPGVAQVVLFLTDGKCEPRSGPPFQVDTFLSGLRSHEAELFQFYLLRFPRTAFSAGLKRLAERTGGEMLEAAADQPTEILHMFATALSRSQGYEATLVDPLDPRVAAHFGARRVRLLAMAPGAGPPLGLEVDPAEAGIRRMPAGVHRFGDGRVYRYAAASYPPVGRPVTVRVSGSDSWRLVALPEYRLSLVSELRSGACDAGGRPLSQSVEIGEDVCFEMRLENEERQTVGTDVTSGRMEAEVLYSAPGQAAARPLPATQTGERATFRLQRSNLDKGDHIFEPFLRLHPAAGGNPVTLRGASRTLQVVSLVIAPQPPELDLETVFPGELRRISLRFDGTFPRTPGRLEMDRSGVPDCLRIALGEAAEGELTEIAPEQPYLFTFELPADCPLGPGGAFRTSLSLTFPEQPDLRPVSIPLAFLLDTSVKSLPTLDFEVTAGAAADRALELEGGDRSFEASLELSGPWPEDDLELGFVDPEKPEELLREDGGRPLESRILTYTSPESLRLRARPKRCCRSGIYKGRMRLEPQGGGQPITMPIEVRVGDDFWLCWGPRIAGVVTGLLFFLLSMYVGNMFLHSQFLQPAQLSAQLVPLRWNAFGGVEAHRKAQFEVESLVRRGLGRRQRVLAWLKANPLVFGLPGGRYEETVELHLEPHRDVDRSQVRLVPEYGLRERLQREPEQGAGRLFASAWGGLSFFAVYGRRYRLGRLVPKRLLDRAAAGEDPEPSMVMVRGNEQLVQPVAEDRRQEGRIAGWQVG